MNTLTYEEALEIYNEMERLVDRTDEDILYLYNSLIERAIRYAHTRSEWTALTRQERIDKDESRSILHECCTSLLLFRHILGGQTDMIYKRCPRCNKRIEAGTTCECSKLRHREYARLSRDKESANFYHSSNWQRMREYIMNKYDNLDVYAYVLYGQIEKAETVHHIVELKDDKSQALLETNLIPVSQSTHNFIHAAYNKSEADKRAMQVSLYECLRKMRA